VGPGIESATANGNGRVKTARAAGHLFLSPEWVQEAVRTLQAACKSNPYLKNLVSRFNLNVVYLVRNLPPSLKQSYGSDQVVVLARLHKGAVTGVEVDTDMPKERYHLVVKSDYKVAQSLLLGQTSPVSSFFMRRLSVEAVDGFHQWPSYVPKAIATANMVLRVMRGVPTEFETRS
jgi:hypothetical protein